MNKTDINLLDYNNIHQVALVCSYLSTVSYENKDSQQKWLRDRFDMSVFKSDEDRTIQYYIINDSTNKISYVVIRGTDIGRLRSQWKDLVVSLKIWPKKLMGGKVHYGYYQAGERLYKKISDDISKLVSEDHRIVFTGHSLGGAIAKYIAAAKNIKSDVITFGAPCVANGLFYDNASNVKFHKYHMEDDLIPKFPSILYNDICGHEYLLRAGGITHSYVDRGSITSVFVGISKLLLVYELYTAIKNHNIKYYSLNLLRSYKKNKK